jgi:hypothetical protein
MPRTKNLTLPPVLVLDFESPEIRFQAGNFLGGVFFTL